jgi:hypothetical protein
MIAKVERIDLSFVSYLYRLAALTDYRRDHSGTQPACLTLKDLLPINNK